MIDQPHAIEPNNGTALEMIMETRRILEQVVTSSESFDYRKAKFGIKRLNRMIRELAREEARMRGATTNSAHSGPKVVPFPINPRA